MNYLTHHILTYQVQSQLILITKSSYLILKHTSRHCFYRLVVSYTTLSMRTAQRGSAQVSSPTLSTFCYILNSASAFCSRIKQMSLLCVCLITLIQLPTSSVQYSKSALVNNLYLIRQWLSVMLRMFLFLLWVHLQTKQWMNY